MVLPVETLGKVRKEVVMCSVVVDLVHVGRGRDELSLIASSSLSSGLSHETLSHESYKLI